MRVWLALALLWLIGGSAWIVGQFWTSPLDVLVRLMLDNFVIFLALTLATPAVRWSARRRAWPKRKPSSLRPTQLAWAAVLFALPQLVASGARGHVNQFTSALVYTLVPVVVILVTAHGATAFGMTESPLGPLMPALAGVGGAALLLPFTRPESLAGYAWLAAVVVSAMLCALAAVKLHGALAGRATLDCAIQIAAVTFATSGCADWHGLLTVSRLQGWDLVLEVLTALMIGGSTLLLTVWLLPRLPPVAFSSRYLAVPLVAIAEGFVLLRPDVTWTTPVGMLLLGFGSWQLIAGRVGAHTTP